LNIACAQVQAAAALGTAAAEGDLVTVKDCVAKGANLDATTTVRVAFLVRERALLVFMHYVLHC